MKLERRDCGASTLEETPSSAGTGGKKPVIVYIFVLFIVAFLLMALSLLIHQRSNAEALGALSESVSAMQGVQGTQEKIISLQEQLAEAREQLDRAEADAQEEQEQAAALLAERDMLESRSRALLALYELQQHYSAGELEACRALISDFEGGLADSLPRESETGVTPPAERYLELKEAVEALEEGAP